MPTFLLFPMWTLLLATTVTAVVGFATGHRPARGPLLIGVALSIGAFVLAQTMAPLLPCVLALAAGLSITMGGHQRGWPLLLLIVAAQPGNLAWRAPSGRVASHEVQLVRNDRRTVVWQDLCLSGMDQPRARQWADTYDLVESQAPLAAVEWTGPGGRRLAWHRASEQACMHSEHGLWPLGGGNG